MASDVMPLESVIVKVVQDGQTRLVVSLGGLSVIRLRLSVSSGVAPVSVVTLTRGSDLGAGSRPEPSVLVRGLQVGTIASGKVALPARGPDVTHVSAANPLLDELVLLRGLQ